MYRAGILEELALPVDTTFTKEQNGNRCSFKMDIPYRGNDWQKLSNTLTRLQTNFNKKNPIPNDIALYLNFTPNYTNGVLNVTFTVNKNLSDDFETELKNLIAGREN